MTRVEILNIRLEQFSNDLEKIENRRTDLWRRRKDELKRVLSKYFHVSGDKFTVEFSDTRAFLIDAEKGRYWSIVEAIVDERWSREDDADKGEDLRISHNGSTYKDIGEWVLDEAQARFEFIQCAVDHKDDILAEWNVVSAKYEKFIDSFRSKEMELRKAYNSQAEDIRKLEEEAMIVKLTSDGVEFTKDNRGNLPELDVRFDWTLRNVSGLKITKTTPSGKSADLVITQKFRNWNSDRVEVKEQFIEKVRMDKVSRFLRSNEELIKND